MNTPTAVEDPVTELRAARRRVAEHFTADEPLTQAALSLIDCAIDVIRQLPRGDVEAARQALGSARAAVVAATCAVRRLHDLTKTERA